MWLVLVFTLVLATAGMAFAQIPGGHIVGRITDQQNNPSANALVTAKGADPDTLVASAKAYLSALNKLMSRHYRGISTERRIHSTDVV